MSGWWALAVVLLCAVVLQLVVVGKPSRQIEAKTDCDEIRTRPRTIEENEQGRWVVEGETDSWPDKISARAMADWLDEKKPIPAEITVTGDGSAENPYMVQEQTVGDNSTAVQIGGSLDIDPARGVIEFHKKYCETNNPDQCRECKRIEHYTAIPQPITIGQIEPAEAEQFMAAVRENEIRTCATYGVPPPSIDCCECSACEEFQVRNFSGDVCLTYTEKCQPCADGVPFFEVHAGGRVRFRTRNQEAALQWSDRVPESIVREVSP